MPSSGKTVKLVMKTQTWPRAMHRNVVCLCVFRGSALLLLSQGGRRKSWSQLDGEDTPTAVSAWAQWNTSATAKAFRWHSSQLSPCPALAIKLMELWQQLWLISGRNHLSAHYHFSIIYIFPGRGEYFVVTVHRLFLLPWEAHTNIVCTWKLMPEALQLVDFYFFFISSSLS